MRYIPTILLSLITLLLAVAATFLVLDGNLARLTGWYRFQKGGKLFEGQTAEAMQEVDWMRIQDLHSTIECEKHPDGTWWITSPYQDRMSPVAAQAILNFTEKTRIVDTLPLNSTVKRSLREFGVETRPFTIVIKKPKGDRKTSVARYTIGSQAPWYADAQDGKQVLPTCYLRSDFYGRDKRIHVVTGSLLPIFKNGLRDLRDLQVLQVQPDAITGIDILSTDENTEPISMQRISAEASWNLKSPIVTEANQEEVKKFINKLCGLTAIRVNDVQDVELPETGQASLITIKDIQGNNISITLYPETYNKDLDAMVQLACVSDRNVVFTLQVSPRIRRKGEYASIINAVYKLPILPESYMAKIRTGNTPVYSQDLKVDADHLRSRKFTQIKADEIVRLSLRSTFSTEGLRLVLIPGDEESQVKDLWMYSIGYDTFANAETSVVNSLVNAVGSVPVEEYLADAKPGETLDAELKHYGLNEPDYTLTLLPRPCPLRSYVFGCDMPLIKDRTPQTYIFKRYQDVERQEIYWVGCELGGSSICRISPKLTRNFSLLRNKWKERQLLRFTQSSLREMRMDYQQAPLELQYDYIGESWTGTLDGKDISANINPYRAQHYLRALQALRVFQWLDYDDADALRALEKPVFKISLGLEINQISEQSAAIIGQAGDETDPTAGSRTAQAESLLQEEGSDDDQKMRDLALADYETEKKTITLEIAPVQAREDTMFYGRILETGEIFMLTQQDALSLASTILEGI
ncbi:MAG: DUF4340 domain-containing protein [Akkermansia sp.]